MEQQSAFEIKTIVHKADSIYFTWHDSGGMYNVYRDGNHLYEGTVAEFRDGDFKHAKMYTYSIERVVDGGVVDVIALQTSAFAEQKSKQNPLQSLVMTTVVAKTQIALSWEEMNDVDGYEVFRNGHYMKTVTGNCYIDRDFSLDEAYTYTIHSQRPLVKSEERFNVSKSIASQIFGLLNPVSSQEETAVEVFSVTKMIAKPKELLEPVEVKSCRVRTTNRWRLRYTTFLTEEWVVNPNVLSRHRYFKGDGRGFNPHGESYRTRVDIELAYDEKGAPLTFTKVVGPSLAYSRLKRFLKKDTASHEGIDLQRLDHEEEEVGFHLTHTVGNPLTTAPEIDYVVHAVLRRDGTFDIAGVHDQAPHHEVYMMHGESDNWLPIHQAESKGLAWMSRAIAGQYWRCSSFG